MYWRVKAHQKSLSTLESPKVQCFALYCFYLLTTYLRTYTHRSDFLQMTRQSISLSIITLTRILFSKTLTPYKHGNACETWILIQVSIKCYTFPSSSAHIHVTWTALEAMDHAKYLGMDISKDLSWNTHINRISTNAKGTLGFLKRNIKTKNTAIRTAAYQTLVCPQVEYASTVWSPFTQTYINKIEMVQRRAVCWVNSNYSTYASVSSMLDFLEWRSLEDRRANAQLILFHKIVFNINSLRAPKKFLHALKRNVLTLYSNERVCQITQQNILCFLSHPFVVMETVDEV